MWCIIRWPATHLPFALLRVLLRLQLPNPVQSCQNLLTTTRHRRPRRGIVRRVFLEGAGMEYFWNELWPMSVIAAVTLSMATWLFRHRMY